MGVLRLQLTIYRVRAIAPLNLTKPFAELAAALMTAFSITNQAVVSHQCPLAIC